MKTSVQWWNETKASPELFKEWLQKQYNGELTASSRIGEIASRTDLKADKKILLTIAKQEMTHALWILDLLTHYEVEPRHFPSPSRYWTKVDLSSKNYEEMCAIAGHAEAMRLERIRAICNDHEASEKVREVFQRILRDEMWHERAFKILAGQEALARVKPDHDAAKQLLGLEP